MTDLLALLGTMDLFSFASGMSSILGLVLAIFGFRKGRQWLRAKSPRYEQLGPNLLRNERSITNSIVVLGASNTTITTGTPPDQRIGSLADDAVDPEQKELLGELRNLLDRQTKVSAILMATHRLAKRRGDKEMMRWAELEMDGYVQPPTEKEMTSEPLSHRALEGYFLMRHAGGFERLEMGAFESKSIERIERLLDEARTNDTITQEMATPDFVKELFAGSFPEVTVALPNKLTMYIDRAQFQALVDGVRTRVRRYLRSIHS